MTTSGLHGGLVRNLLLCCALWVCLCDGATNISKDTLLDTIFLGYDSRLPPANQKDAETKHVEVYVNIYIVSIYAVSEISMDYSMSMFLRERWDEPRFAYDHLKSNITRLELDSATYKDVWVPDIYILNEKNSDFHEVTVTNKMIHVYPKGTIQYSMRVTGTFACEMNLNKYPFDTQECKLEFESYGHSTDSLRFIWRSDAVTVAKGILFPQFTLQGFSSYNCEKDYYGIVYPCIGVSFVLVRSYGYYITQIYVPSLLVVLLSWVNFWLDCEAVPARISLGLLTVLTMTTQSSGSRADLPRVSYVKAIDIWMATCLTFVFAALVEFAYVNVLCRAAKRKSAHESCTECRRKTEAPKSQENGNAVNKHEMPVKEGKDSVFPCCKALTGLESARTVDKTSRILFPLIFLIFNVCYWAFYFLWIPNKTK